MIDLNYRAPLPDMPDTSAKKAAILPIYVSYHTPRIVNMDPDVDDSQHPDRFVDQLDQLNTLITSLRGQDLRTFIKYLVSSELARSMKPTMGWFTVYQGRVPGIYDIQ